MKSVWLIQSETNIHVGNENTSSVGLIDKAIQKDVLTGIPCINASSLKGAMNEYATIVKGLTPQERINIFGVDKSNGNSETQKGGCAFFDASLLLLPIQDDTNLYRLVTCKEQLENFISLATLLGSSIQYNDLVNSLAKQDSHFNPGKDILSSEVFKELCNDDELPIIARNKLDNGKSANLWYEQALPQKTTFGMIVDTGNLDELFTKAFDKQIIQIGANATIGYGYCQFNKIK